MKITCEVICKNGEVKEETLDYSREVWLQIFIDLAREGRLIAQVDAENRLKSVIIKEK